MLAFNSLLPVVVLLLHHVSSHPLFGPEEDTADTAEDRVTQHVPVIKTRVTRVTPFLLDYFHINFIVPRTSPGIDVSGPTYVK